MEEVPSFSAFSFNALLQHLRALSEGCLYWYWKKLMFYLSFQRVFFVSFIPYFISSILEAVVFTECLHGDGVCMDNWGITQWKTAIHQLLLRD